MLSTIIVFVLILAKQTSAHARLSTQNYPDFASGEEYIDRSMAEWRRRWSYEIQSLSGPARHLR